TRASEADGDETCLAFGIRIFDGNCQRILKCPLGVGKRDLVLLEVLGRLRRVVLEPHAAMVYILYAYRKRAVVCEVQRPSSSARTAATRVGMDAVVICHSKLISGDIEGTVKNAEDVDIPILLEQIAIR